MRRSRIAGLVRIRRTLRRLDPALKDMILREVEKQAGALAAQMKARSISSRIRAGIRVKVRKSDFAARVGIIGKRDMKRLFFARFVEFGTPSPIFKRGKMKGKPRKPVAARPFMKPAFAAMAPRMSKAIGDAVKRALRRTVNG